MSAAETDPDLLARYGRRPHPTRRRVAILCAVLVAAVAGGWLAWTAWFHGTPEATSALVSWEVVDDTSVQATFDVSLREGAVAQCRVEAYDRGHAAVGSAVVVVPTEAGDADGGRITATLRTTGVATAVEMIGCTTADQRRPR